MPPNLICNIHQICKSNLWNFQTTQPSDAFVSHFRYTVFIHIPLSLRFLRNRIYANGVCPFRFDPWKIFVIKIVRYFEYSSIIINHFIEQAIRSVRVCFCMNIFREWIPHFAFHSVMLRKKKENAREWEIVEVNDRGKNRMNGKWIERLEWWRMVLLENWAFMRNMMGRSS